MRTAFRRCVTAASTGCAIRLLTQNIGIRTSTSATRRSPGVVREVAQPWDFQPEELNESGSSPHPASRSSKGTTSAFCMIDLAERELNGESDAEITERQSGQGVSAGLGRHLCLESARQFLVSITCRTATTSSLDDQRAAILPEESLQITPSATGLHTRATPSLRFACRFSATSECSPMGNRRQIPYGVSTKAEGWCGYRNGSGPVGSGGPALAS